MMFYGVYAPSSNPLCMYVLGDHQMHNMITWIRFAMKNIPPKISFPEKPCKLWKRSSRTSSQTFFTPHPKDMSPLQLFTVEIPNEMLSSFFWEIGNRVATSVSNGFSRLIRRGLHIRSSNFFILLLRFLKHFMRKVFFSLLSAPYAILKLSADSARLLKVGIELQLNFFFLLFLPTVPFGPWIRVSGFPNLGSMEGKKRSGSRSKFKAFGTVARSHALGTIINFSGVQFRLSQSEHAVESISHSENVKKLRVLPYSCEGKKRAFEENATSLFATHIND